MRDYHNKWNKSERERQIVYDIVTYMCNLKCETNEPVCETETHSQTQRVDCCCQGDAAWEWDGLGVCHQQIQTGIYKMGKQGSYTQYPVINHNGKEYRKECVFMYNWVTLLQSSN